MKPKAKPATNLQWRTFHPERYFINSDSQPPTVSKYTTILVAQVLGPCIIIEKTLKDKRTIQRIELEGIDTPNIDTYLAIHTTDTQNRQLVFILPPTLDKYLLALPRSGIENLTITNETTLFTQSRDHDTHLHTDSISIADLDLLKIAIEHWKP